MTGDVKPMVDETGVPQAVAILRIGAGMRLRKIAEFEYVIENTCCAGRTDPPTTPPATSASPTTPPPA